jgi:hypothetical protein
MAFTFVHGDPLTLFDPLPERVFHFHSIHGSQTSLHFSKKLHILISMETSELPVSA